VYRRFGAYIEACLRIRRKYLDRIFLADYLDREEASINSLDNDVAGELMMLRRIGAYRPSPAYCRGYGLPGSTAH
jgi:hypothetical protein